MLAFIDIFRILGAIFVLTLPLVWLMKSPRLRARRGSPGLH